MATTEQTVLRTPRVDDVDALYPLIASGAVTDTLLWDGPTSLAAYRESWQKLVDAAARGERHIFVIVDGSSEDAVGTIALRPMAGLGAATPFRADIGLWIGAPYQGRGLGTAAVRALVSYGFENVALEKIEATVFVGNAASRRIFEKAGFVLEGTLRNAVMKRGVLRDEWLFGITRSEWAFSAVER